MHADTIGATWPDTGLIVFALNKTYREITGATHPRRKDLTTGGMLILHACNYDQRGRGYNRPKD